MRKFNKINELLGSDGKPMPLSQVNQELANAVTAPDAGTKDGNPTDDMIKVNTEAMVGVALLSPAQKEVIPMKALSFALGYLDNKQPNLDEMEAIISGDMYIMDGHHRWAAAILVDPKKQVKVAKIEMPANDLITALNIYTKGALKLSGNTGDGDLNQWKKLIVDEINKAFDKGFSAEAGNAILPGKKAKPNWPMFDGTKGKTSDEVKELFKKIQGSNGDAEKGKEIMISNSALLKTTKLTTAPLRIDMPVIDAGLTPAGEKTKDVKMSQLYDVCLKIQKGQLDFKEPYTKEVSALISGEKAQESRIIKTYEKFVNLHKSSKTFDNYQPTNEGIGLALIAGVFGAIFAPGIYREAKNFWSKNVIGSKYKETGNVEKVICQFERETISPAVKSLTISERETGKVEIPLKEYKDIFGNLCCGYVHSKGSESVGEKEEYYTAMYRVEDLPRLKEWLADGKRYAGKGTTLELKPLDLIYIGDVRNMSSSGTPIG